MERASLPLEMISLDTFGGTEADDALLLAASWERRCLGSTEKCGKYKASLVLMTVYDGLNRLREDHIKILEERLLTIGSLKKVAALHANPLQNVRDTVKLIRSHTGRANPKLTIDISTFTRKHLLQLLQGLDLANMLGNCRIIHTEPMDYDTRDNESISEGISDVKLIEGFAGDNVPSRDSVLILFLGYEGRRALALWEHLEPNISIAVIPDPPYRLEWHGRTEDQNRFLLSSIPRDRVFSSHSLDPESTCVLLNRLVVNGEFGAEKYKFQIAPVGTKPQTIGLYKFWRSHRGRVSVMYVSPGRYRHERANFPAGRTWCLANTSTW